MKYLRSAFVFTLSIALAMLMGCESNPKKSSQNPKQNIPSLDTPQKIRIRENSQINSNGSSQRVLEKNLANITVSPNGITLNGTKIKNETILEQRLKSYSKPVITISAHKCTDSGLTTRIMQIAQGQTNTPIPFRSYGNFSDKLCH